jgi:hypothetical protein
VPVARLRRRALHAEAVHNRPNLRVVTSDCAIADDLSVGGHRFPLAAFLIAAIATAAGFVVYRPPFRRGDE